MLPKGATRNLSLKALGLLYLCAALADNEDWEFSVAGVASLLKPQGDGETKVRSALDELMEKGYCSRERTTDAQGRYDGIIYTLYPLGDAQREEKPHTENPHVDNQGEYNTNNNKILNKQDTENKRVCVRVALLPLPYTSPAYVEAWQRLITSPKWRVKNNGQLNFTIKNKLAKCSEQEGIRAMDEAYERNWQGLFIREEEARNTFKPTPADIARMNDVFNKGKI